MSKARGLISGGNYESRSSGMYDSADNIRIAAVSTAGLKKVGIRYKNIHTTGFTYPYSFTWSPDGLHLYIAYSGDYIRHIECTTPFSTSGSSIQATFNHSEYESANYSLEVSPDGRYLYFGGSGRDTILQFTMNTAWDITETPNNTTFSAGYEQLNKRLNNIFGIGSADSSVRGCNFNNDGTKFYLIGFGDDNIHQFSLSTAYEVGTQSYDGAYSLGGDGVTSPYNFRWNNDGTKFFVVNYSADDIVEYSVSNAYDVTSGTITEGTNFDVSSKESNAFDVAFNADGTKMFVIGNGGDEVNEWTLSTGFDLSSTVTHVSATSLGMSNPAAFDFNPDGTKMVVVDYDSDLLKAFNLSSGFDSSTISSYQSIDLSGTQWDNAPSGSQYVTNYWATPTGCRFNGDGSTITVMDRYNATYDKAVTVPLTTAYELSTFSDGCINAATRGVGNPRTCRFNPDGTKCYVLDLTDDKIYQWSLNKPYVLGRGSTAMVYDGVSAALTDADSVLNGFDFIPDGTSIFTCSSDSDTISHYTVSVPFDVTSTLTYVSSVDTTGYETAPSDIKVVNTPDGYKIHFLGIGADKIFEMDINF